MRRVWFYDFRAVGDWKIWWSLSLLSVLEKARPLFASVFARKRACATTLCTASNNLALRSLYRLDVLEEECFIKEERELLSKGFPAKCDLKIMLQNHVLIDLENVIVTPHNAFNSKEAMERILQTTVSNIIGFIKGRPVNRV